MSEANLTFKDLYTKAQYLANDSDSTVLTYIKSWMNDRYQDALSRECWPFMLTPSNSQLVFGPGNFECDLPEDFKEEIIIYDAVADKHFDGKKVTVEYIRKNDPDNSDTCTVAQGTDEYYFPEGEDGGKVAIHPKVDEDETESLVMFMDYVAKAGPLVNDYDKPRIPNNFRNAVLVNGVLADYYLWKGDDEKGMPYENKYEMALKIMAREQGIYSEKGNEDLCRGWEY